jgi:hypothetical protein
MNAPMQTAALAGVPSGIQSAGVWTGRRQLFIRFAGEAETATMYTSGALVRELAKIAGRATFHSICAAGRDVLGNAAFLAESLTALKPQLPVMLDTDGQRPEALASLRGLLTLVQVTVPFVSDPANELALETLKVAVKDGYRHALVLAPRDETPDPLMLRVIERASAVSKDTMLVIHPSPAALERPGTLERRWASLLETASSLHGNVRLILRVPPPAGLR